MSPTPTCQQPALLLSLLSNAYGVFTRHDNGYQFLFRFVRIERPTGILVCRGNADRIFNVQIRRYAVPAQEKVAKFKGTKGSDVRAHPKPSRLSGNKLICKQSFEKQF